MQKRPSPKTRSAAKQPVDPVKASSTVRGTLAGRIRVPSNTQLKDVLVRLRKLGGYGIIANSSREDGEISESVSIETIPWGVVSDRERVLAESAIDPIIARATEVIGDRQEAMRWLGAPVRGLDFATPISLLATEEGQMRVNDILGQMEHGIW